MNKSCGYLRCCAPGFACITPKKHLASFHHKRNYHLTAPSSYSRPPAYQRPASGANSGSTESRGYTWKPVRAIPRKMNALPDHPAQPKIWERSSAKMVIRCLVRVDFVRSQTQTDYVHTNSAPERRFRKASTEEEDAARSGKKGCNRERDSTILF